MLELVTKNKEIFKLGLTLIFDRALGFFLLYLLIRIVSDEFFSFWTQVNALPGMLCGILTLGFGRGILRLFIDNNLSVELILKMLKTIILIFLSILLFAYILIYLLGSANVFEFLGGKSSTNKGILALFLFIIIEGLYEIYLNYLRSKLSSKYLDYLMYRIIPRVFFGILIINTNDFWLSIFLYIFLSFMVLIFLRNEVHRCIFKNQKEDNYTFDDYKIFFKKLSRYSIPLMFSALAFPLLNLIIRGNVFSDYGYDALGIFSIYMSFVGILIYFPESFHNYIFPKLAKLADSSSSSNNEIYKQFYYYLLFTLLVCIVFYFIGPFLLKFLYPKSIWSYNDALIIASTAFCWVLFFTLQRFFLVFHPLKNYLITLISFISFLVVIYFEDTTILLGPSNGVILIAAFFLLSSLFIFIALQLLSNQKTEK